MGIDIISLKKALATLEEVVAVYNKDKSNFIVRDSLVQRYEYTYELAYKTIKMCLEEESFYGADVREMSFQNIIRYALETGLLREELEKWAFFRKARNVTSHTYASSSANDVLLVVDDFVKEVRYFLSKLEKLTEKKEERQ